ncbi:MAG: glycosyltransferase family 4 protein [Candidatus Saccharimonas sp.]
MRKKSSTIFALNKKLYDKLLILGFPKKKTAILEAGIDFNTIKDYKVQAKHDYDIVVLGRLTPVKGIYDMISIWGKVHANNPTVKIAWMGGGSSDIKARVEHQLREKGISNTFSLLGYLDKSTVFDIMKSAKIFLCPDHENGWGLAVCEAMACGLPVVSYDLDIFGGVYKQGFVSSPLYDTDAFAENIIDLLTDSKKRRKLSREALVQASEFDHKKVIDSLVKYL